MSRIKIQKEGNSVFLLSFVPVGSRYERSDIKGISHFVEHMLFKGTTNRTKEELAKTIDQYGGQQNAWTDKEGTSYWIKIAKEHAPVAEDILQDMLRNATFPEDEIEKEREVILQEIKMYQDNPRMYLYDNVGKYLYKDTSGLYEGIAGSEDTVKNITRDDLVGFHSQLYKNPITIQVGGNEVEETPNIFTLGGFKEELPEFDSSDVIIPRAGIQQSSMFVMGVKQLNNTVDNRFSARIFQSVLNGTYGRLFQTIREKYGFVYSVYFDYEFYSDGLFQWQVYAGLDEKNIQKTKEVITEELVKPLSQEDIDFAVGKLIGKLDLRYDDSEAMANSIVYNILHSQEYNSALKHYPELINAAKSYIHDFINAVDLNTNKLVAVVPK